MNIYIDSQIVVQTGAQWALDSTVYSGQRLLVTSDETYTGTDQRKFKIANGVDTWSNLDYFPAGGSQTLAQTLALGKLTNEQTIDSNNGLSKLSVLDGSAKLESSSGNFVLINRSTNEITIAASNRVLVGHNSATHYLNVNASLFEIGATTRVAIQDTAGTYSMASYAPDSTFMFGQVGGSFPTVDAAIHIIHSAKDQFKSSYNSTQYWKAVTNNIGETTFTTAGSSPLLKFNSIVNFPNLTASTLPYLDASKNLVSLANASGVLTNDGAGNLSWGSGGGGASAMGNTGALTYGGMTAASTTTVNIGALKGWVVDNETDPLNPVSTYIDYPGASGVTVPTIGSGQISYLLFLPDGGGSATLVWQNTFPTSAQRKTHIYASKASHPNLTTLGVVGNETDYITSPLQFSRDFFQGFPYINKGIHTSASAANLTFATSTGKIIGDGINFYLDRTNPNEISRTGTSTTSFFYRTQLGGATGAVTNIDPTMYDVGGVITAIPGGVNVSTIQYIYAVPFNGAIGFVTQYGQTLYSNLAAATAAVGKEEPVIFSNLVSDAILVGYLAIRKGAADLTDTTQARFSKADMFGQSAGGAGGTSVSTIQQVYTNSGAVTPKFTTTTANDGWSGRNGGTSDTEKIFRAEDIAGTERWYVNGHGDTNYWKGVAGTPTRVGNTSFTITDTANANLYDLKYGRTTVLKWTDTAVTKMAMIVSATYSANNVTITIIGDTLTATATMSTMSYSHEKCKPIILAIAGTLSTGTDLTGRYFCPSPMKVFGADGYHMTAGTTNATTYDINKNGTTFMTTKLSIASGATSGLGFTADSGTETALSDYISVDCDSVSTTAPIDAYIELFMMPLNNQYL